MVADDAITDGWTPEPGHLVIARTDGYVVYIGPPAGGS
jgi:hypothetical protein